LAKQFKDAGENNWGYRLVVRTTFGFYNLSIEDLIESGIPNHVGTLAVVPELEFETPRRRANWQLLPFFGAGAGKDFQGGRFNFIFAAGIRSRAIWPWAKKNHIRLGNQLIYSVATTRNVDFSDDFCMFDTTVDIRKPLGIGLWSHALDGSVYAANFLFLISPRLIDLDQNPLHFTTNWEIGVTLGAVDPWKVFGLRLPRIGIGYRFDSQNGAVRILIGETVPINPLEDRSATFQ
jgi:hypothetical protein